MNSLHAPTLAGNIEAMPKVFANSRSIVHAGDGLVHTCAPPDVCKTPSPAGPTPAPYVNVARSSDLAKGTKRVKIGGKSVAHAGSNLKTSTGDEAGTADGGLISNKTKGKLTWASSSPTVRFEGEGVIRFADTTQHNGNTFNSAFTTMGGTGLAYGDDFEQPCPICGHGPEEHRVMEHQSSVDLCQKIVDELNKIYAEHETKKGSQYNKAFRMPYMIGVMVCGVCGEAFAARSGADKGSYFGKAVSEAGCIHVPGKVTPTDLAAVNACVAPATPPENAIDTTWEDVIRKRKENNNYGNSPGNCAGQKLMAVPGHVPYSLTERFYMPPWMENPRPMEIPYLRTDLSPADIRRFVSESAGSPFRREVLANRSAQRVDQNFAYGHTVGSCQTCQDLLFMTNCPVRVCGGGSS